MYGMETRVLRKLWACASAVSERDESVIVTAASRVGERSALLGGQVVVPAIDRVEIEQDNQNK